MAKAIDSSEHKMLKALASVSGFVSSKMDVYKAVVTLTFLFGMFISPIAMATTTTVSSATAGTAPSSVICTIYNIYTAVNTVVFVIGLLLMILGGAVYAASHVMPGQSKGTVQGYGMGMVMGGIIGVLIALLAPYILQLITGTDAATFVANAKSLGTC